MHPYFGFSAAALLLTATSLFAQSGPGAPIRRVSESSLGEPTGFSSLADITPDGRYIVFASSSSELVPNDTNGETDVFLRDTVTGTLERVSVGDLGQEGNDFSTTPAVSDDGRFVVFQSNATNLIPGDVNAQPDVFLRDRQQGTTIRISQGITGIGFAQDSQNPAISGNGQVIAFRSRSIFSASQIWLYDRNIGIAALASTNMTGGPCNGDCHLPQLSGDGQWLVYGSDATDLVPQDWNGDRDIFMRSVNGSSVSFRISESATATSGGDEDSKAPRLNQDGSLVVFYGESGNLIISDSTPGSDCFLARIDTTNGSVQSLEFVSLANGGQQIPSDCNRVDISSDGTWIAFETFAGIANQDTNGDLDIYQRNLATGQIRWVSRSIGGGAPDSRVERPAISDNGDYVVFQTIAGNLIGSDTNGTTDIFRYQAPSTLTAIASFSLRGTSCAGPFNTATLDRDPNTLPWVGEQLRLVVDSGLPNQFVLTYLGPQTPPTDLTSANLVGCTGYLNPQITLPFLVTNGSGIAVIPVDIPVLPGLLGFTLSAQCVVTAPGARNLGLITTNAADALVGG